MPIYEFKAKDPISPYYDKPYEVLMSYKEYQEKKDNMKCPETGVDLVPIFPSPGGFTFNFVDLSD